ncbi:MAG TPA: thioredoxin family protein [Polyangiaceae bacterium]|nr:thioredoxin family protein [Polyangiaceae bacterium]
MKNLESVCKGSVGSGLGERWRGAGALLVGALLSSLCACSKPSAVAQEPAAAPPAQPAAEGAAPAPSATTAAIGQPAPDFTLPDLDGKQVSLAEFRGKPVVLEWFNPGCPFVRNSHTVGSLKGLAAQEAGQGVAWLAINSGGAGKQGNGVEATRKGQSEYGMQHPILLDESGNVGHLYGAERTPHMYVINSEGVLVYRGAIDNSPDGEGQSPEGGKLVNYVASALQAVRSGGKVDPAETKPYGCSVKYQ